MHAVRNNFINIICHPTPVTKGYNDHKADTDTDNTDDFLRVLAYRAHAVRVRNL